MNMQFDKLTSLKIQLKIYFILFRIECAPVLIRLRLTYGWWTVQIYTVKCLVMDSPLIIKLNQTFALKFAI